MNSFMTSDNTRIFYDVIGIGNPIIFIHGFAAKGSVFRIPQKILSKEFLTVSYDLRGHGISSNLQESLSMDILARDLYEMIDFLKLVDVTLVGWSMGGSVIFEYISKYGCKNLDRIVIVDTGPKVINTEDWRLGLYNGNYDENRTRFDLDLMGASWKDFSKSFMNRMAPFLDDNQLELAIKSMMDNDSEQMVNIWRNLTTKDYRKILGSISVPTLIIMGGKSNLYSIETGEYLKESIDKSSLLIFEDNGHLLVQENPTGFSRALKNFIK